MMNHGPCGIAVYPKNVPGDLFFVDSTCIDCDTCSQLAPAVFRDHGDHAACTIQPTTADETKFALMSLVACPTGSIGTTKKHDAALASMHFRFTSTRMYYFCGFTSESSFWRPGAI
jgi:ferredoxin